MGEHDSDNVEHTGDSATSPGTGSEHAQHAPGDSSEAVQPTSQARPARRRSLAAGLIGAVGVTLVSLVFVVSFIGALHKPGPRSVPLGFVGTPSQASILAGALSRHDPGGFVVTAYPSAAAARSAIGDRSINAALVPGPRPQLLVASAVGQAVTNATVKVLASAAAPAGVNLETVDIRPPNASDPQGLSEVYFVIALLAPSLVFGNLLVKQVSPNLHPLWHLAVIVVYAAIVAAVATAIADAWIGALVRAPWNVFGIGTLFAFTAAVVGAAAQQWTGGIGYILIALLFIPIGIASSGTTLGPNMITPWYARLGRALPPGSALPAVQNTIYFHGNATTRPLLILSAWALGGAIALALTALRHPRPRSAASSGG